MRKYTLIDIPVYVVPEMYEVNVSAVSSALMNHGKVQSVYRIGSVSAPGISDIDLLVVFKDGASTPYNPLKKCDTTGKYLFVHKLFGASYSHFQDAFRVTQFHNYRLIGGSESRPEQVLSAADLQLIKTQTALEFMIKMVAVMNVQRAHGIMKVRSFLLEARALEYDLEFLNVRSGELYDVIQQIIELRKRWFLSSDNINKMPSLFDNLFALLTVFVSKALEENTFYTNEITSGKFASNIFWKNDSRLTLAQSGLPLPAFPARFLDKKYFNLKSRFRSFQIRIPVNSHPPAILKERFDLNTAMAQYNSKHIPQFMPLSSSLKLQ
jgi:hypothetical protein